MRLYSPWIWGPLCALVVVTTSVRADQAQDKVLLINARANIYGESCPNWKVNWLKSAQLLEAAGFDVNRLEEQPVFERMTKAAADAGPSVRGLEPDEICRRAESEFGPKGTVAPNLMSNSLAIRGMNRLFDWLEDWSQ